MNRKQTILIAVLVNAGLLAVLLVGALTTEEEVAIQPTMMGDAAPSLQKMEENPLFQQPAEIQLALQNPPEPQVQPVQEIPIQAAEPLVHKLPPLVLEEAPIAAAPAPQAPAAPTSHDAAFLEVVVKKGDNLEKIARIHHTTVDEIIRVNHLPNSFLRIGQKLRIPRKTAIASQPATSSLEKKPAASNPGYYTVKVGDNPWTIAMKHHMKVDELLRLNALNEEKARRLKPGDRLRVR
jgi:LysM repeat protein